MRISFYHMNGGVVWKRISGAARGEIKRRNRTVRDTDDGELKRMMQDAESRSYSMLGVPDGSPEADVLAAVYRLEGDRII